MRTISTQTYIERFKDTILTDRNQLKYWLTGLGLSIGLLSNKVMTWGNVKWEKLGSGLRLISTLPGPNFDLSSAKANLRMKDSTHVNIQPLVLFGKGMLPVKIIKILILFAVFLISIIGYTVIEENLTIYIVGITIINSILLEVLHDGHSISKWGNLGKSVNTITDPLYQSTSLYKLLIKGYKMLSSRTNYIQTLGKNIVNKDGGKIAEKANANGNSLDTKLRFGLIKTDIRLLNSVRLNQVSNLNCVRSYSTDSNSQSTLDRKKPLLAELTIKDFHEITNKVKAKQFELVRLAELKGLRSKEVQDFQILLAKSLDFRLHALDLLKTKKGSQTDGVDKMTLTYNDGETLYELNKFLRDTLKKPAQYKPQPIKRVWIPKPGKTEKRPLGIPTIKDRAIQTLINLVLLPLVELTSEPNSYGFRPYRDCKMAIGAVKSNLLSADYENIKKGILAQNKKVQTVSSYVASKDKYILDAHIKGFFDNINHNWIIENVFLPAQFKLFVQGWLKAKIIDINDTIDPTSGTPQGGIISPTLANMTLNGLENVILNSIKTLTNNKDQFKRVKNGDGTYNRILIGVKYFRYADDFIVLARSKNIIIKYVKPAIEKLLKERGLWLSSQKTNIFKLSDPGVQLDFLGYTFKYQSKWSVKRGMLLKSIGSGGIALYPNKNKVRDIIKRCKEIFKKSTNLSATELISKLNPIIGGWGRYFNMENSSKYRVSVQNALYLLCWRWLLKKHPKTNKQKLAKMYFLTTRQSDKSIEHDNNTETFLKFKNRTWVFHGMTKTENRYTEGKRKYRTSYLQNPTNVSPIITARKYLLPVKLRNIHAFHQDLDKLIAQKLQVSLLESAKTPLLKDKLYYIQNGLCYICNRTIEYDKLHENYCHIHHIRPIVTGGNKFNTKNLSITHSWCHRKHTHDLKPLVNSTV